MIFINIKFNKSKNGKIPVPPVIITILPSLELVKLSPVP